ncbi:MAG: hypothetical protein PHT59_04200 [Candidatus Omnitrophica bacterium]|nr:hypothetical protein [Candidatus Omnitrophota bacterium]
MSAARDYASKTATLTTLPRIVFTLREPGAADLSPRARVYLAYVVALAKMGYVSIAVPINALTRAQQAAGGRYRSDRSTYLALAELESKGYLRRSRYRIGDDHFRTVINLNLAALSFWTGKRVGKCTPISSKVGYVQGLQKEPWTSKPTVTTSVLNSEYTYLKRTMVRVTDRAKAIWKWAPVLYTLRCLAGSPRAPEVRIAAAEYHGLVESMSGIDWPYWDQRWSELSIPVRESTAQVELLPALREAARRRSRGQVAKLPNPINLKPGNETPCRGNKNPIKTNTYSQDEKNEIPGIGVTPEMVREALAEIARARLPEPFPARDRGSSGEPTG